MKFQWMAVLAFSTVAVAGSVQADEENSRIQSLERDVQQNSAAIGQNAQDISNNTSAISTNATGIANNGSAISANATGIAANAAGIQANANAIAAISSPTTYDFHNFATASNVVSKTYALNFGGCREEVREFAFAPTAGDPDSTDLTLTRTRLSGGNVCQMEDFIYRSTPSQRLLVAGHNFDPTGTLVATKQPESPILLGTSSMAAGSTVADGALVTITLEPIFGGTSETSVLVQSSTIVGLQDVTVLAGNFTGCLKMVTQRTSNTFGEFHRTSWLCPGVGEVKRIQVNTFPGNAGEARRRHQTWELSNITYAP